jgi:hypothetical protein
MHKFYFNECLPQDAIQNDFVLHLSNTLKAFNTFLNANVGVERSIITDKLPSEIFFERGFTLLNIIQGIPDNELRTFAFAIFGRHYPINAFFDDSDEDLLSNMNNYRLTIANVTFDALNLAVVYQNEGFLFTPALSSDLTQHPLLIRNIETDSLLPVNNLYGSSDNTNSIIQEIENLNLESKSLYDQLVDVLGSPKVSNQFPRDFKSLTVDDQKAIVYYFQQAKKRNGPSFFFPDGSLIKVVTPNNAKNPLSELRIFKPKALRVYFCEKNNAVYMASIGFKNAGDQDNDIRTASSCIDRLILTSTNAKPN